MQTLFPQPPADIGLDLRIVQVGQNQSRDYCYGQAYAVDDGSSESGKVREDEGVDIDNDGEVDEECASASVSQENQHLVG